MSCLRRRLLLFGIVFVGSMLPPTLASADMAPPMAPPGGTLLPGGETTRVRMLAETVTLSVDTDPNDLEGAIARTEAVFTLRNLGASEEKMLARFPLSFPDGGSDGYFNYPEIPSISVKVDGRSVPTQRALQPPYNPPQYGEVRADVPWAVFDVTFPPAIDVTVEITYSVQAYGYYPQLMMDYVLETGAAWSGTIGSADIIVRLPYEANDKNVLLDQIAPAGSAAPNSLIAGGELRWHFVDFEPTADENIQVTILAPSLWRSVLKETEAVHRDANDGEAWGRLAKAYEESARYPKGWLREDATGAELLELSQRAYERCLELLPRDALWHYGYADLLWSRYYWLVRPSGAPDAEGLLPRALAELQTALALDPDNQQAIDMLIWIAGEIPDAVELVGDQYVFLALTATPPPPTPYPGSASATSTAKPTSLPAPTPTDAAPTSEPPPANPLCGAGAMAALIIPVALVTRRRMPQRP